MSTTQQKTLSIDGMHCEHCVEVVREALEAIRGVSVEHVEIGTADVAYDPSAVSDEQLATVLDDAGYDLVSA
jgi:copper chaperone CopZ